MKIDKYCRKVKVIEMSLEETKQANLSFDCRMAMNMYDLGALNMIKLIALDDPEIDAKDYLSLTIEIERVRTLTQE